jgi:hypothetical protein
MQRRRPEAFSNVFFRGSDVAWLTLALGAGGHAAAGDQQEGTVTPLWAQLPALAWLIFQRHQFAARVRA